MKNVNSNRGARTEVMEDTDSQLLRRYKRGQVDALEQLVERYKRPLYGFIYNMTRCKEEAEEIFQEVWFRAIKNIAMYKEDNFSGWLTRIARNIVIDRIRRRKPDFNLDQETDDGRSMVQTLAGRDPNPGMLVEDMDTGTRIANAVEKLPAEQKEVFLMRAQADLSFKEIARAQKVSINTALARMQYALSKLRIVLKRDYEDLAN